MKITLKNVDLLPLILFMKSEILSKIGVLFLKFVAKFPFEVIYLLANIFYFLIYYVFGYRKKVVFNNLKNSFPEKTEIEIKQIQKDFYQHLADLTMETVKMHGMSEKDYEKRFIVKNGELLNSYFDKGKSVVVLTSHYNNWEWGNGFPLFLKHQILGVYKPLHNGVFDKFMIETRSKFGAELIPDVNILRRVIQSEKDKEPVFTWLAGDQAPPPSNKFWFRFLNQDTIFFQGPAFISRKFNHPVFFQETKKIGRGIYEISFELLFENPKEYSDIEIISTFIKRMEKLIIKQPEYYLWSHKRWKHKRPAGAPLLM